MFRWIRELLDALSKLSDGCLAISAALRAGQDPRQADDPLRERLAELEQGMAVWQAECEALVLKAKAHFNSARNAEERTKTLAKATDGRLDEGDPGGEEALIAALQQQLRAANGDPGAEEEVLALRPGVGLRGKAAAQAMKYGA